MKNWRNWIILKLLYKGMKRSFRITLLHKALIDVPRAYLAVHTTQPTTLTAAIGWAHTLAIKRAYTTNWGPFSVHTVHKRNNTKTDRRIKFLAATISFQEDCGRISRNKKHFWRAKERNRILYHWQLVDRLLTPSTRPYSLWKCQRKRRLDRLRLPTKMIRLMKA